MQSAKSHLVTAQTLVSNPVGRMASSEDGFAFARRLQTPVWIYDIDACAIVHANGPACRMWQAPSEEALRTRDMSQGMSSTVAKRMRQYQNDFIERDATFREMWTLYPNGEPSSVMVIFSGFRFADGRMGMQCEVVGETDDTPDNLRSAEALLHTDVMISLYSREGPPLYMNPAARNISPESRQNFFDQFLDKSDFALLMQELDVAGEYRLVAEVATISGPRWHDISARVCSDAATGEPAILVTSIDVSDLKIARDKARYLADRDQLTGCYNRSYLQQHMALLAERPFVKSAILYLDVDRFKQINDQFGHEMGDIVLKELADRSRRAVRRDDIIVRQGGDEFIILLEDSGEQEELSRKVDDLLAEFARPIVHEATRINVNVSMGIAMFSSGEVEFAVVMRQADLALYASKQAGRNRFTFFTEEMGIAARERDRVEVELMGAIENREFVLHFQPRVDMRTGRVVSVEALVRWMHPDRGLIMPDSFIPVCEETGMIEDLGQQILEMGIAQVVAWQRAGLDLELSLNISPRQFNDERLMQSLGSFSKTHGFPHGKVELEITENVLIGDHDLIARKLQAITEMGYRVAIDDFGTGYSNLSYISLFPLTCLKVDRSFINQLPQSGPIIQLIIALARQIGATIVAEGVETKSEFDWLLGQECDQVQGYYMSRALPLDDVMAVIGALNAAADTTV